jgi:hypothetical protein
MLPSIDIRIQNLVKAIEQVVLPAVDPENKLAQEQARLVIAHLHLIGQQWDKAHVFETQSLKAMCKLAAALVGTSAGGSETMATAARVKAAAEAIDFSELTMANAVAQVITALGTEVDALIFAISADGSDACRRASKEVILEYSARQARRERVWFAGNALDPNRAELVSIDEMLGEG